jgi:hypothetical protein
MRYQTFAPRKQVSAFPTLYQGRKEATRNEILNSNPAEIEKYLDDFVEIDVKKMAQLPIGAKIAYWRKDTIGTKEKKIFRTGGYLVDRSTEHISLQCGPKVWMLHIDNIDRLFMFSRSKAKTNMEKIRNERIDAMTAFGMKDLAAKLSSDQKAELADLLTKKKSKDRKVRFESADSD